ncbi:MAG TPA: hypothetical protein PKV75_02475 [Desulfobacterales bacterium]|nr:hypothetical protein [Desulfobacterales bacterium]
MTQTVDVTNPERIIYSLNVEDVQRVAQDKLSRDLRADEIKKVEERVGDYILWYEAIDSAIDDVIEKDDDE